MTAAGRSDTLTATQSGSDELEMFRAYVVSRDRSQRNALVERYMGLAAHIAKRYQRAGNDDDIRQAAMIGLVKAVDRFDPEFGVPFASFAGSTIEGELKRYLRDHTWVVRVPRSAKELHLLVRRASDELAQTNGHAPSVAEIAAHLTLDRDDVLRGLAATAAYDVGSLDNSTDEGFVRTIDLLRSRPTMLASAKRSIVRPSKAYWCGCPNASDRSCCSVSSRTALSRRSRR